MKIRLTLFLVNFLLTAFSAWPAVQSSNIKVSNLQCNSLTLTWTSGDGAARIIVAREGALPDFEPTDHSVYSGNPHFGHSVPYGTNNDNYVVYNSSGNSVNIDSLRQGKVYYFTIYEHNNNGALTQYLIPGAPTIKTNTHTIQLDFSVHYADSCQAHNKYEFKNNSISTIPGINYMFLFGDGDTSESFPEWHSYKIAGNIPSKIVAITNITGCMTSLTKSVRVYQKKMAYFDFTNSQNTDTVQAFYNHRFRMYTGNYTNPHSTSYSYRWFTENDTSVYSFFSKQYDKDGRHKVSLEVTANYTKGGNTYPTGCKDTMSFTVFLGDDELENMQLLNSDTQMLDTNHFDLSFSENKALKAHTWLFGDGTTSSLYNVSHTYGDSGTYKITLQAYDTLNNYQEKSVLVRVNYKQNSNIKNLKANTLLLYPNPSSGVVHIDNGGIPPESIIVYNASGVKIMETHPVSASAELDLSGFGAGIYFIQTTSGKQVSGKTICIEPR